jgi:hypothetical protein
MIFRSMEFASSSVVLVAVQATATHTIGPHRAAPTPPFVTGVTRQKVI